MCACTCFGRLCPLGPSVRTTRLACRWPTNQTFPYTRPRDWVYQDACTHGGEIWEIFHRAASVNDHKTAIDQLLAAKDNVNAAGGEHGSALQAACVHGHADLVSLLINARAGVSVKGSRQCSRGCRTPYVGRSPDGILARARHPVGWLRGGHGVYRFEIRIDGAGAWQRRPVDRHCSVVRSK